MSKKISVGKTEQAVLVFGVILIVMSIMGIVQGYFETVDYIPHIIADKCYLCLSYLISIPCTISFFIVYGVVALKYYFNGKSKLFYLLPAFLIVDILPSLAYDLLFIAQKGFTADNEYNIIVYLAADILSLLNAVVFFQVISGRLSKRIAAVNCAIFFLSPLVYISSVFVFYGSIADTNFMGYYFCSNVCGVIPPIIIALLYTILYSDEKEK